MPHVKALLGLLIAFTFSPGVTSLNFNEDFTGLSGDYAKHFKWNYVTIVSYGEAGGESRRLVLRLFSHLSRTTLVQWTDIISNGDSNLPTKNPEYRMQFIVVWEESGHTKRYMMEAAEAGLFTKQQEWLLLLDEKTKVSEIQREMKDIKAFVDSEVIVVEQDQGSSDTLNLFEVWGVGDSFHVKTNHIGSWDRKAGVRLLPLGHKYDRRKDLMGVQLRVSTIKAMPYVSLTEDDTDQNFKVGYVVDVWHTLQEQLNFTYKARHTLFGSLQEDKVTWNGMVGDLQKQTADAAVAPLSITKIRSYAIDFTLPIQMVSTRLYIRRPQLEASWELYALPFDGLLWILVPCGLVFASVSVWFLNKLANWFQVTDDIIPVWEALWTLFCSICQQAAILVPVPFSGRFMLFTGYATSMVLFTCYSAVLVSILATMEPMLPFEDFEGLLKNPSWDLGVRTNTALADSLALAPKNSPMRLAWEKHVVKNTLTNLPTNNDDALESVIKGKYAFFANKEYIIYRMQNILPIDTSVNLVDTGQDFLVRGIGFGLQKNSPYRNAINHVLSKMSQSGHLDRLKSKWWPNIKREPPNSYPVPGFNEVFTVFMVWGIGLTVAVVCFLLEKAMSNAFKPTLVDDSLDSWSTVDHFKS